MIEYIAYLIGCSLLAFYIGLRKGRVDGACSAYLSRRVIGDDTIVMLRSKYLGHDPRGSGK